MNILKVLRWIFCLPLAVAVGALIIFVFMFQLPFDFEDPFALFLITGVLAGLGYMWVGTALAPSHKLLVGALLILILAAYTVWNLYESMTMGFPLTGLALLLLFALGTSILFLIVKAILMRCKARKV